MAEQKQDGLDLDAIREELAKVLCDAHQGDGCKDWDREDEVWRETYRDQANAILAAGWVSPAAVAERDAELERLRTADQALLLKYAAEFGRRVNAEHRLGAVAALHVPWYEIAGVRHEHRVLVAWDEAPDDHVCVIGRTATVMDVCDPGDTHAVLACAECRASGGDDTDVAHYPFYPCATAAVLGPVSGAVEHCGHHPADCEGAACAGAVEGAGDDVAQALAELEHEIRDAKTLDKTTQAAVCAVIRGHIRRRDLPATPVAGHEQEVRADELRKAVDAIQRIYDMQCPTRRDRYPKGKAGEGSWIAHRWWSVVLGGELERLRNRADRLAARTPVASAPVQGGAE
jgi:hypothetical protein